MARRQPTAEQKRKAAKRRERFTVLAKHVAAMGEDERAALVLRMGAIVTVVGRALVELAGIEPGHTVLEPSAGTGALVRAIREACEGADVTAVEVNPRLAEGLAAMVDGAGGVIAGKVTCADFLALRRALGRPWPGSGRTRPLRVGGGGPGWRRRPRPRHGRG
jgi:hypothetical protein